MGNFSSKASLFTCFWLVWMRKPQFFTRQMPSHIGGPRSAVALRLSRKLRCFGLLPCQRVAICRLLVGLGVKTSVFYAPDAPPYWWATNCRRVAFDPQITVFWAAAPPKPCYLQAVGRPGCENLGVFCARCPIILVGHKLPSRCARPANYGVLGVASAKFRYLQAFGRPG